MKKTTLVCSLAVSSLVLAAIACSSQDPGAVISNSGDGGGQGSSSGSTSSSSGSSSSSSSSGGTSSSSSSSSGGSSGGSSSGSSSGTTDGGSEGGAGGYGATCTTPSNTTPVVAGTDPACTGTYDVCANDQGANICTKTCTNNTGSPITDPTDCPAPTTGTCTPKGFCK